MRDGWLVSFGGIEPVFACGEIAEGARIVKDSIISFSALSSSIDIHAPLEASGGASITLPRRLWGEGDERQPERVFGGVFAPFDAPRLSTTLSSTATSCTIVGDVSGIVVNRYIHIGTECLKITAVTASDTNTKTITVSRGQYGSLSLPHYGNTELNQLPVVSSYPFAWVGRLVYLYHRKGGIETLWRIGQLTDAPRLEDDTVVLNWAPLAGKLTDSLGGFLPSVVNLSEYHYFSRSYKVPNLFASTSVGVGGYYTNGSLSLSYNRDFEETGCLFLTKNFCLTDDESMKAIIGGQDVVCSDLSILSSYTWAIVPFNAPVFENQPVFASLGNLQRLSLSYQTAGYKTLSDVFDDCLTEATNRPLIPSSPSEIDPLCIVTPTGYFTKIVGAFSWYYGHLYTVSIPPDEDVIGWSTAVSEDFATPLPLRSPSRSSQGGSLSFHLPPVDNWASAAINSSWDGLLRYPIRPSARGIDRSFKGSNPDLHLSQIVTWVDKTRVIQNLDPPLLADRWWEFGEEFILLNQSLGTGSFVAKANWTEPHTDKAFEAPLILSFVESGAYGYLYRCRFAAPPYYAGIGDWGGARATFERSQLTPQAPESVGMIDILESIDGVGGTYGTLSRGLSIPEEWIDLDSFFSLDLSLSGLRGWVFDVTSEAVCDVILPALLLSGTGIAGKIINDSYKIARIPVTPPIAQESVLTVTDDDFIGLPKSSLEGGIITSYVMKNGEDEITFTDVDAVQVYGQGSALEVNIEGARWQQGTNIRNAMTAAFSRCIETHGKPFRKWVFTLPFAKAVNLTVGDVLTVTSSYLYGYGIERGVSSHLARITEIEHDIMNDVVNVTCLAARGNIFTAGYHPWALISSTSTQTTFSLPLHDCTPSYGTINDVSYFRVGASVAIYDALGNLNTRTISSISGNSITLNSGIDTGGAVFLMEQTTLYNTSPQTYNLFEIGSNKPF